MSPPIPTTATLARLASIAVVVTGLAVISGLGSAAAATSALPPFTASVSPATAAELGGTWRPGCPVGPAQLVDLSLRYIGFDGHSHLGSIVVAKSVETEVERVFSILYRALFPIRSLRPEAAFAGRDPASMAADNSSGFNCRYAVAAGAKHWSVHAYGEAIDINPVENPYVFEGVAQPSAGRAYLDRHDVRPGMAVAGGTLVEAFAAVGWYWGGRWSASPDYQHFSATGG